MPGMDGFETCRRLKADPATRDIPVIFMTARAETRDRIEGFAAGAADYVVKPLQHEEVLARINAHLALRRLNTELHDLNRGLEAKVAERTAELRTALDEVQRLKNRLLDENAYLKQELREQHPEIVGDSPRLRETLARLAMVAPTDATVLISGETGTGKELVARAVHEASRRRDRPMVKLNCSAISAGLVESELFGHVKGAFTGAVDRRARPLRAGRRRDALPRRGGRAAERHAGEAPARAPGAGVRARRQLEDDRASTCASSRRRIATCPRRSPRGASAPTSTIA